LNAIPAEETMVAETFESLAALWRDSRRLLRWDCPFVLPSWLRVWWDFHSAGMTPLLTGIRHHDELLGIATLMRRGDEALFMGSPEVCDYFDFVVVPGKEPEFFRGLMAGARRIGIHRLDLGPVRADSTVCRDFLPMARNLGCTATAEPVDVTLELDLPSTWDDFLLGLSGKERHEVRRKLRRLEGAAEVRLRVVAASPAVAGEMDCFLELMRLSRPDKAAFLTPERAAFFRSLAAAMAEVGLVRLFLLDLDHRPAAAALCFDHDGTVFLYNSGYDPSFGRLSAGLLDKVFSIRESIAWGRKRYDFLKGAEPYKYRLGGHEVALYRCRLELA